MSWNPVGKIKEWLVRKAIKKTLGEKMLAKIMAAIDGHKMQITALLVALRGLAESYGVHIPTWADSLLAAFGIIAAKSAIAKTEPK